MANYLKGIGDAATGVANAVLGGEISNSVIYYPLGDTYAYDYAIAQYILAANHDGLGNAAAIASNVYVFSDQDISLAAYRFGFENVNKYAKGALASATIFTGLNDDYWDVSGKRATFNSTKTLITGE
jgi:hypothetical protein